MIRGALLAASVAAALRLPVPAVGWPLGSVCKASCAGPPPTSVIGFNKPITLYGYTQVVGTFYDSSNSSILPLRFGGAIVPSDVGCKSPLSQVLCQEIADFASDFFCAEGEVATSSCVPVSEEVQGPLCGMTCAGVAVNAALQGAFNDEIPDGTEGTITLAIAQQGAEMTDEMCTAACAISEASCMENPGNPVFTCLGAIDGPSAPVPVPAPAEE
uniref:Uncharacterized protein n=1 Tax=Prasinoderma singulare TaxID=676789 RepID=A0A7S3C4R0_9VIRI|mmetsp:Transcript_8787/g.27245  ORF Transcript_8787/g.27245 Transcript_8787/m.27245 type:complete len:215 (+) Transcript_8787:53-697(+)